MSVKHGRVDRRAAAELARGIRREALRMTHRAGTSHIGSALSMADLLAALYSGILAVDPAAPEDPRRDRFVLSKGHACSALYAALALRGFFPQTWLSRFCSDGSPLAGHASHGVPGVEVSTGSLGHGLSLACGMAVAGGRDVAGHDGNEGDQDPRPAGPARGAARYRVFALLSDGECDEGSTWEAALFAAHHALDNLIAVVDYNRIQGLGAVAEVLALEPFADKWRAFGWDVRDVDGHDLDSIARALEDIPWTSRKPSCLLAHTRKGHGVSFMEGRIEWHYRSPDARELAEALAQIDACASESSAGASSASETSSAENNFTGRKYGSSESRQGALPAEATTR